MPPKVLVIPFLIFISCNLSIAASDSRVRQGLDEVIAAKEQTDVALRETSSSSAKQRLQYISDRLESAENLLRDSLGGGGGGRPIPPPPGGGSVEFYRSDSCSGSMIGAVGANTRCDKFAGANDVWAIKVAGKCINIPDTSATIACESFKGAADPSAVEIYSSDSCSGNPHAIVSSNSDCENLPQNSNAWGVKVAGNCVNIADTSTAKACEAYKGANSPSSISIFYSDSCSGKPTAIIDYNTRCENLRGLPAAWGIMMNGRCENIPDMEIEKACERYRP